MKKLYTTETRNKIWKLIERLNDQVNGFNVLRGRLQQALKTLGKFLKCNRKMLTAVLLTVLFTILLTTAISILLRTYYNTQFPTIGTIQTIGVQAYGGDLLNTTGNPNGKYLDWGKLFLGSQIDRSFYIKSVSNLDVILNLNATNWNPTAMSDFMNLAWNYTGAPIRPGQTITVKLTLSVSLSLGFINYLVTNRISTFSFDVEITPKQ
jgi:hypothetical protein